MPKIILTSRYLRDAPPEQLENYVRYVSTREGMEKVEGSSTALQKELIRQIVCDIPSTKEMLGYAEWSRDYKLACRYLYGEKGAGQDLTKAFFLFRQEAGKGNA